MMSNTLTSGYVIGTVLSCESGVSYNDAPKKENPELVTRDFSDSPPRIAPADDIRMMSTDITYPRHTVSTGKCMSNEKNNHLIEESEDNTSDNLCIVTKYETKSTNNKKNNRSQKQKSKDLNRTIRNIEAITESGGFIQFQRSMYKLLMTDPNVYLFISQVAFRTCRTVEQSAKTGLKLGEAYVGDWLGLTRYQYEAARNRAQNKYKAVEFTLIPNCGTIAKLTSDHYVKIHLESEKIPTGLPAGSSQDYPQVHQQVERKLNPQVNTLVKHDIYPQVENPCNPQVHQQVEHQDTHRFTNPNKISKEVMKEELIKKTPNPTANADGASSSSDSSLNPRQKKTNSRAKGTNKRAKKAAPPPSIFVQWVFAEYKKVVPDALEDRDWSEWNDAYADMLAKRPEEQIKSVVTWILGHWGTKFCPQQAIFHPKRLDERFEEYLARSKKKSDAPNSASTVDRRHQNADGTVRNNIDKPRF